MHDHYEREYTRHELKQRYNRRFFIAAHTIVVILLLPLVFFLPAARLLLVIAALALVPHALYVAWGEYQHWLERRIDSKYRGEPMGKRKRYASEAAEPSQFRLTDDGEIEPVAVPKSKHNVEAPERPRRRVDEDDDRRDRDDDKRHRRRKDDTDEFDVKSIMEKLKDIVD